MMKIEVRDGKGTTNDKLTDETVALKKTPGHPLVLKNDKKA